MKPPSRGAMAGLSETLDQFLAKHRLVPGTGYEGYSQQVPQQVETLGRLFRDHRPHRILEIGFNAGHSAEMFLSVYPDTVLLSFDLGAMPAVSIGKRFIDNRYAGRHALVIGDSTHSVPAFTALTPEAQFDFLFIDGGHSYEVACADIRNCARLAGPGALVAMDDTVFTPGWEQPYTIGPTRAWLNAVREGTVVEYGREDYSIGRGMAWGRYATAATAG